jgi:hypothetical protein
MMHPGPLGPAPCAKHNIRFSGPAASGGEMGTVLLMDVWPPRVKRGRTTAPHRERLKAPRLLFRQIPKPPSGQLLKIVRFGLGKY